MASSSDTISSFLDSEVEKRSFPSAQYAVGEDGRIIAEDAIGLAVVEPEPVPATLDTFYDLASLTKPLVTSLLVVMFAERGQLDLNSTLAVHLNEFDGEGKRDVTLLQLLTHTSGLPNWRPLYLEAASRDELPAVIARISLERNSSSSAREVIYSDLNYILLGFVLERLTSQPLDKLAQAEIFEPLGLTRTMFNPPPELIDQIAATEHGQSFELANAVADLTARRQSRGLETPAQYAAEDHGASLLEHSLTASSRDRQPWRKEMIRGKVHDGNAHFMAGVAGHAGLFSTARECFRIANQCLRGSKLLKPESLHWFSDNLTCGRDTSRSIAWILAATRDCSAGPALPPSALGHNGFTGTSIWIDPGKRRVFVLLTNRVHPRVYPVDMRVIRQRFNALAVEMLEN